MFHNASFFQPTLLYALALTFTYAQADPWLITLDEAKSTLPKFLAEYHGPHHLAREPNRPHSPASKRAAESLRMWTSHCLFERPLCTITESTLIVTKQNQINCHLKTKGIPETKAVSIVLTPADNPDFLKSKYAVTSKVKTYTTAKWHVIPLEQNGDTWTLSAKLPSKLKDGFVYYFDLKDVFDGQTGYTSTHVKFGNNPQ